MVRIHARIFIATFLVLLGTSKAFADCYHNGQRVPEGTRIGPVVCQNGSWILRP
jgi:hypothetical protein